MAGLVCLQGGAEFGRACRGLDLEVVRLSPPGDIVVVAAAAAPGAEYAAATRNGVRYYERLVGHGVVGAPDPREDAAACLAAIAAAALIVLPGGSPSRLLDVMRGPIGEAVAERHAAGTTVSGASAGAMVLCQRTVLPDRGEVTDGLGLVEGLAYPHFDGVDRWSGRLALPEDAPRWGLPECGGVLIHGGHVRAAGAGEPTLLTRTGTRSVPREPTPLDMLLASPPATGD